jgi:hypothetical protein
LVSVYPLFRHHFLYQFYYFFHGSVYSPILH